MLPYSSICTFLLTTTVIRLAEDPPHPDAVDHFAKTCKRYYSFTRKIGKLQLADLSTRRLAHSPRAAKGRSRAAARPNGEGRVLLIDLLPSERAALRRANAEQKVEGYERGGGCAGRVPLGGWYRTGERAQSR
jgi:hypothetical protein